MKSRRTQIISLVATIILVVGFVLVPGKATAQTPSTSAAPTSIAGGVGNVLNHPLDSLSGGAGGNFLVGYYGSTASAGLGTASLIVKPIVNGVLEVLANWGLSISNLVLSLSGVVLNAVMIITLNMSTLMGGSNNIIDATWSTIRDLASIIIIFFLLYESIKIIIGVSDSKVKHIIVMVAIAGILLNFSLFFAKMGVDASNLVGLAFYRAIAPSGANLDLSTSIESSTSNFLTSTLTSGGIADEFMGALKIQTADVYHAGGGTDPLTIIQSALYGIVLQLIAAFVFLAAAFLFLIRVGLLIVLLVFSPFYFIGLIVPKVAEKISKPWLDMIIDQCLILPIFMFFMYTAMRVITNSAFQSIINPAGGSATLGGGSAAATIGMFIQYFIAIILICISLVAALKYASVGKDIVNAGIKKTKGWAGSAVKGTAGFAGRNTFGVAATKANESEFMKKMYETNPNAARLLSGTFAKVGSSYGKARKETEKKNKEVFENIGKVDRAKFKEGPDGDMAYNEAKNVANSAQANYLANMRKSSVWSRVSARASGSSLGDNRRSSYGMAYGKEGKKLHENLEKQVKAKETERDEYLNRPNVPQPIPGAKGNKADQLEKDIRIIKQRMSNLAQYKPGEKEEEEMAEKIKRDLKEEMESGGGGKKGGGSKKSEGSDDSAKEKLSGDKP
jgi:hypothetical protein